MKSIVKGRPKLSVCMIMKNAEETIEKSLRSLDHLRETIPCEVIVADTGSTDNSVELARACGAEVFYFEWIDDFSAARNAVLDRATGEWALMLDSDEWFENTDDLEFLLKQAHPKAQYATYFQRNYTSLKGDIYTDFAALRVFKRAPGRKYKGRIHEELIMDAPFTTLRDYVHHYGYVRSDVKSDRNRPLLLKTVKEDPDDLHAWYQLLQEYIIIDDYEKAMECSREALRILDGQDPEKSKPMRKIIYVKQMFVYYQDGMKAADILETVERFFDGMDARCELTAMDAYYLKAESLMAQNRHAEAAESMEAYFALQKKYKANELDLCTIMTYTPIAASLLGRIVTNYALCCYDLKRYDTIADAVEWLLESRKLEPNPQILKVFCKAVGEAKRAELAWPLYAYILERDDPDLCGAVKNTIDDLMAQDKELCEQAGYAFAENAPSDDAYANLVRLRCTDAAGEFQTKLCERMLLENHKEARYGELIYFAVKYEIPFSPFLEYAEIDDAQDFITFTYGMHGDSDKLIRDWYAAAPEAATLRDLRWEVSLLERTLLRKATPQKTTSFGASLIFADEQEDDLVSPELFGRYCRDMALLTKNLYRPEILCESEISILPGAYRFGYYVGMAAEARERGDIAGYMKLMVKAGEVYPAMLPYVRRLHEAVTNELEAAKAREQEREMLLEQIKDQIRGLAAAGNLEAAEEALAAYSRVNPDDEEILSIRLQMRLAQYQS